MAVYTPISDDDARALLARYAIGELRACRGIAEGVENSNFLLETTGGAYILTLFEKRTRAEDLPYFIALMAHWSAHGIRCPRPVQDKAGRELHTLHGKPALIVSFIEGFGMSAAHPQAASVGVAEQLGALCAQMHLSAKDFPQTRANALSVDGWGTLLQKIGTRAEEVAPGLSTLLAQEYAWLQHHWPAGLPGGPVHADLFPDNVFFLERDGVPRLSGVIDFYFSCNEAWMYDLAICINAWGFRQGMFQAAFVQALLAAYASARAEKPVTEAERSALPILARGAAMRFLLTRTHDVLFHPAGALVTPKDPLEYREKLQFFQTREWL